jgi:23S rRNA pseudouridine2605 synthase
MRLQKFMADCGVASRRASETYIKEGRVKVNGRKVAEMGVQVNPDRDVVSVDGKRIRPPQSHGYYAFYKPRSVASTCHDDRDRKTVLDYFKNVDRRLFPVGRLDYDSEGLMILTDDGDFALRATHPRYRVGKTYRCTIDGGYDQDKAQAMLSGVDIGDATPAKAAGISFQNREDGRSVLTIVLLEGRNRQIRRMLEAQGYRVLRLRREAIGGLEMGDMKPGTYRRLSASEVEKALTPYRTAQPEKEAHGRRRFK